MYKVKATTKSTAAVNQQKDLTKVVNEKHEYEQWAEVVKFVTNFLNSGSAKSLEQSISLTISPVAKKDKKDKTEPVKQNKTVTVDIDENENVETSPAAPIIPVPKPTNTAMKGGFQEWLKKVKAEDEMAQ